MSKEIMKEAASIEEAKALIAAELGVAEDAVTYTVLQEPEKKVLGLFGGTNAIVKGELKGGNAAAAAEKYLRDLLDGMGVTDYTVDVTEKDNHCTITLDGENLGFIIGRRGETLDALQYLTGLVVNRIEGDYLRVTIDSGNFREKREKTLEGLARRLAKTVVKTGRSITLEPMNPYERRIIHSTVSTVEGATSSSIGEEPNRKVVISSTNPRKPRENRDGNRKSR